MPTTHPPASPLGVSAENVTVTYGQHPALNNLRATFAPGQITALVGPNGAGKSTLGYALAGWRPYTTGSITLTDTTGAPHPTTTLAQHVLYTDGTGILLPEQKINHNLKLLTALRPAFSIKEFTDMLAHCDIPLTKRPKQLSTGKRAALAMATALAAGAPITILDEAHNGMDANTRDYFVQKIIALIAEQPRTIIISSHLIAEIDLLADDVVVMQSGAVIHSSTAEELRGQLLTVQGRRADVDAFGAAYRVLSSQDLGTIRQITIDPGHNSHQARTAANAAGLEQGPVSLQDAVIALTNTPHPEGAR